MENEILLMATGAAKLLNRSAEQVRFYERSGRLPALKTDAGIRLFRKADVLKLAIELNGGDGPEPKRAA